MPATAALACAAALLGCPGPAGIPTLTVSASPRQIDDKGQTSKVSVDAVDEKGKAASQEEVLLRLTSGQLSLFGNADMTDRFREEDAPSEPHEDAGNC